MRKKFFLPDWFIVQSILVVILVFFVIGLDMTDFFRVMVDNHLHIIKFGKVAHKPYFQCEEILIVLVIVGFNDTDRYSGREYGRVTGCDNGVTLMVDGMAGQFFEQSISGIDTIPYKRAKRIVVFKFAGEPEMRIEQRYDARVMFTDYIYHSNYTILVDNTHFRSDTVIAATVDRDIIVGMNNRIVNHMGRNKFIVVV